MTLDPHSPLSLLTEVVTNSPVVLFAIDKDGRFALSEGRGLVSLGLKPGEVVGQSVYDVYRDVPDIIKNIERCLAGESFSVVVAVGELFFESHYSPIKGKHGDVTGVIGVSIDITEQERARRALKESQERYRTLFEKNVDGVAVTVEGKIVTFNPKFAELMGRSPDELIGLSPRDFPVPEERDQVATRMRAVVEGGAEFPSEYRVQRPDGTVLPVEVVSRLISHGGERALLSVIRDISLRVEAQHALLESEERFRRMAETTSAAIVISRGSANHLYEPGCRGTCRRDPG